MRPAAMGAVSERERNIACPHRDPAAVILARAKKNAGIHAGTAGISACATEEEEAEIVPVKKRRGGRR